MSLCEHGYTAFWDCPMCDCPGCERPQSECVCHEQHYDALAELDKYGEDDPRIER
jgi:hypothetical protein